MIEGAVLRTEMEEQRKIFTAFRVYCKFFKEALKILNLG